jgi:hypothetical protein
MDQKQLATRLRQLDDACDRIGSNLLELDRHPAVALLKVSDLAGETAERWTEASEMLAGLFVAHGALRALIDDARRQQSRAWFIPRLDELAAMLDGESIVVSDESAELVDRDLLSASRVIVRRSPDQLITEMTARFEQVKHVVVCVAAVWDEMIPRLRTERQRVIELTPLAAGLAVDVDGLARVTSSLRDLSDLVLSDPLAVDGSTVSSSIIGPNRWPMPAPCSTMRALRFVSTTSLRPGPSCESPPVATSCASRCRPASSDRWLGSPTTSTRPRATALT